jgi:hypothetical protein
MKKITILAIMMFGAAGAFAQFNQGRILVGGSLDFSATTNKSKFDGTTITNSKSTELSFGPQVGYFVIDNLAVGAGLEISTSKFKSDDGDFESTSTAFVFQPIIRYYLPVGVFFQGQFGIGGGKEEDNFNGPTDTNKFNITTWGLAVGYAWFLNDYVAVEPQIGYGSIGRKYKDNDVKGIDNGLFISVGIQAYLGNKE